MVLMLLLACEYVLGVFEKSALSKNFENRGEFSSGNATTDQLCQHFKRWKSSGVSQDALQQALQFYSEELVSFENSSYFAIADYSKSSKTKRFYLFNWQDGSFETVHVSHGSGSQGGKKWGDPEHDGLLNACQHKGDQTNMTRVGIFKVSEYYWSKSHSRSWPELNPGGSQRHNGIRMDGLSPTNHQARNRGVVMHEANYNQSSIMGRSYGCPAFRPGEGGPIIEKIKQGGLYYSYAPQCATLTAEVLETIIGWETKCTSTK